MQKQFRIPLALLWAKMFDAVVVERAATTDHAVNLVALVEQHLGQIRTVLPGDASDKSSLGHLTKTPHGIANRSCCYFIEFHE